MKILIIGSRGMLGQYLLQAFSNNLPLTKREKQRGLEVIGWDREEIDITDQNSMNEKIRNLKPDLIINSAAYNNVDEIENNSDLANAVNGYAVGYIANTASVLNIPVIHYSSDYVFDGEKGSYNENDLTNPINKYGKSKLLGEIELQKNTNSFYLIRTSWLFGDGCSTKKSFIEIMLELSKSRDRIQVVNNEISKPTYAKDLADATYELVAPSLLYKERDRARSTYLYGKYHLVNEGKASWYDWAQEIFKIKNIDIEVEPVPSSKFPRPAKRPKNSSLLNTKFPKLRGWQEALREYLY